MNKERLIEAGIDYDEGVNRFAGAPQIYEKYLLMFFEGHFLEELSRQLTDNDISGAFRTAHDLKGTAGNLSINSFYKKICELVELLRSGGEGQDYMSVFSEAKELYFKAEHAVKE